MSSYKEVGKRSFKSKWNIYLFEKVLNNEQLDTIDYLDFKSYKLSEDTIKIYTNEYWQAEKEHKVEGKRSANNIYKAIKNYETKKSVKIAEFKMNYLEGEFKRIFSKSDFDKLTKIESCKYCGITKKEIEALGAQKKLRKKNLRGWNLEIDRLKPNQEYSKENCVMSCYWCNNAKTDEFSEHEFMAIGKEIGIILRNRLNQ